MSRFFILNDCDRPCKENIAELRGDGKYYYIHPCQKGFFPKGLRARTPTSLEEFGLNVKLENGWLSATITGVSQAKYEDGISRKWQGCDSFSFEILA